MILPAVLETDPKRQIQRMGALAKYSSVIHTDIMDGKFVKSKNLNVLKALAKFKSSADLELHLMVKEPAKLFSVIRKIKKVQRIILQIESDWEPAFKMYKKYYEVGVGVKLETPFERLKIIKSLRGVGATKPASTSSSLGGQSSKQGLYGRSSRKTRDDIFSFDFIHLFSITPGAQGNPFRPEVSKRIQEIRKIFPDVPIEIDGGLNPARIKKLKKLGTNDFVVGSFLKHGDIERKMKELCRI